MAYDEAMAARIRAELAGVAGLVEKKMFGGVGWTINGHLATGAHPDGRLMIRCAKADFAAFTGLPGAEALLRGGKPLSGWVLVDAVAVDEPAALATWVARGRDYAASLAPKPTR